MWLLLILSILIFITDRVLKYIVFKNLSLGESIPIIENLIHITPTHNRGIAFGLFKGLSPVLFLIVSLLAVIFIIYLIVKKRTQSKSMLLGFFLIISGACGNLVDRIIYGYVLDFIDLRVWPVFNIADSAITIGTCIILWKLLIKKHNTKEV